MEVVLTNGTVVEASAEENEDLFVTLNGSGGSLGITTHFYLQTFETNLIWTWDKQWPESAGELFVGALKRWTDNVKNYPNAPAIVF